MKKLSTIIALALVITIGGVFAAWHYSIGAVDSLIIKPGLQMTTVETSSDVAKGKIDQIAAHNFTFRVDDTYDYLENDGDDSTNPTESDKYLAMLTGSGEWEINFTANESASLDIQQNGIKLIATVTVTGDAQYDEKVLLTAAADNVIELGFVNETNTATIKASDILGCLVFVEDVVLDTPAKNALFAEALSKYVINISITEQA